MQQQDWNASLYDDAFRFVWQYGANLIDLLGPQPGERILDLGCGTGHLTGEIAAKGAEVIGIDISAAMIDQARQHYPNLRFEVADGADFDLGTSFDAVFSNAALHWIARPEQTVRSISQALKPGGRFVAEFGGHRNVRTLTDAIQAAIASAGYPSGPWRNPWYFPSIAEYGTVLEHQGLETTFAILFDRPTLLKGGENGLRLWLEMFSELFFTGIPDEARPAIVRDIEQRLRPRIFRDGDWHADYRRLRVVAIKGAGPVAQPPAS